MGKHSKQKLKSRVLAKNTEKPVIDEKVRQERVLPVIAALKSVNADERSMALSALTGLIEDRNIRHMLLRERLIKIILTNILSDSSLEIISQGFGVLRNVVLAEGRDPAVFLVRESIKFPLNSVASKALSSIQSAPESLDAVQIKIINQICENICGLTSAILLFLGEIKDIDDVVDLGVAIVYSTEGEKELFGLQSVEAAFEMLYYISENSAEWLLEKAGEDGLQKIQTIARNSTSWPVRIYGLGIKCNVLACTDTASESDFTSCAQQLAEYLSRVPMTECNSVQICLELLALLTQTDDLELLTSLITQVGSLILDELLLDPNFCLQSVSVLNNICWSLNALTYSWESEAENIYSKAMTSCFSDLGNTELVSSALGLISATLVQNSDLVETLGFRDLVHKIMSQMHTFYENNNDEWVALGRPLVVILGAGRGTAVKLGLLSETSDLIFSLLEHTNDVEAQIDALDALFDLFGDNDAPYNQSEYVEKGLNPKLENLKPSLKRSLKSPPKDAVALREQASDALTNLENFLVYKRG